MYVVGPYDFLLSVVGIVAVMMLIIGGMRYITAAGNAAAIGDAKDIISNAIFGLLLALLSWVIVSAINPDVLYIKNPTSSLTPVEEMVMDHGACGVYEGDVCTCVEDKTTPTAADENECQSECSTPEGCGLSDSFPCVGANNLGNDRVEKEGVEVCSCIDGDTVAVDYESAPNDAKCNEVCSNPDWADGKYHGINWRLKVGHDINDKTIDEGDNFVVTAGEPVYFNFSEVRDCKGGLVHFALDFNGGPIWSIGIPDEWCCMEYDTDCTGTWGVCCNEDGLGGVFDLGCPGAFALPAPAPDPIPLCKTDSYMGPDSENYPIYVHTFDIAGADKLPPGPENLWVGISANIGGVCEEFERVFKIDVLHDYRLNK